jgi:biopolymer transport protein ExbB
MTTHQPIFWLTLWNQTDFIGKSLLIILMGMSCVTWYLIISKTIMIVQAKRHVTKFLITFWHATSLKQVENELIVHGVHDPFSHLTIHALHAQSHHAQFGANRLEEAGSTGEFVTRSMRKVIDEETSKLENGLTTLATIGATAPFVGLFGTVWGVYHALMAIASDAGANFASLAGPVGEALVMTGLGLAVAIPAVLAYNSFVRNNRVLLAKLDGFAHELFVFLTTGQAVTHQNVKPISSHLSRVGG